MKSPILGDTKYGDEVANKWARSIGLRRLFLHAAFLRFPWPGRADYEIEAPLPEELAAVLEAL